MNNTAVFVFIFLVLAFHPLAKAGSKGQRIESATQFQHWCKQRSYRHFRRQKVQPYNWSASTIRQFNDYQTRGSWRVNLDEIQVFCQIRVGRKAKSAKMKISK